MSESDSSTMAVSQEATRRVEAFDADGNSGGISGPATADGNSGGISGPYTADGNSGGISGP